MSSEVPHIPTILEIIGPAKGTAAQASAVKAALEEMKIAATATGRTLGGMGLDSLPQSSRQPMYENMDARVAVLEQIAKDNRDTFREIKGDLKEIHSDQTQIKVDLGKVATKGTVWGALGTGAGIAVAIVALFVGILTYLQALPRPH